MPDQFEHYITKNIKAFYKRRLLTPILYLIFRFKMILFCVTFNPILN